MDTIIEVHPVDSEDNLYCAVVLRWHEETKDWYNSGIVEREATAVEAFDKAVRSATEEGIWE